MNEYIRNNNSSFPPDSVIRDTIIFGVLVGVISNIPKELLKFILTQLGVHEFTFSQLAAGLFVDVELLTDPIIIITGAITDLTVAGLLGVATVYLVRCTDRTFPIWKSLFVGLLAFVFLYGGALRLEITSVDINNSLENFLSLLQHILFGIIMGILIKRYDT
ncbi:hypothetical protein [Natranaerobius thermophilus]|uniref:Uncharacterized protein n=1 Tax=Natranaerobius thermophilus (strain ATCC BAA-1301 / DSM 18059 / JW/NM-WN-LF) TaxID=457570 RepID=B2A7C0_NATTJ|nr:hypothetical protein [Natranaerobius thermophilus]ACB84314.1 hypothetical protein Nther_0724 [Natranaerobius thermophilus JW/NM-WN-LF]